MNLLGHGGEDIEDLRHVLQGGDHDVSLHFTLSQAGQHILQPRVIQYIEYDIFPANIFTEDKLVLL
jgi:hypothetical protein